MSAGQYTGGIAVSAGHSGTKMAGVLATLLPPLFFEARTHGGPIGEQLATRLGLSIPTTQNLDVAIFTRTSGTAFAVGIGSFVAYKLLHRLIRSNCLFTALEQLSPEQEQLGNGAEGTIELTEGFYAVRLGGENDLLRRIEDCLGSEHGSPIAGKNRVSVVKVRQANALKQVFRRNQRIRRAGIAALDQCGSEEGALDEMATNWRRRDILQRHGLHGSRRGSSVSGGRWKTTRGEDDDDEQSLSGFSDLTSASRIAPNPRHSEASPAPSALPEQFPECDTPPANSPTKEGRQRLASICSSTSSTSTRQSASLHLNCENELCWEDEFPPPNSKCTDDIEMVDDTADEEGLFLFREREGSLGGLSQLSAMKNLEQMFRRDWQEEDGEEGMIDADGRQNLLDCALENLRGMDRLEAHHEEASTSSIMNLVQAKETEKRRGGREEEKKEKWMPSESNEFPFTAYRIVVQNSELDPSEVCSLVSDGNSRSANPHQSSPLHRPKTSSKSQGLWELTSSATGNDKNSLAKSEKLCHDVAAGGREEAGQEGGLLPGPGASGVMFDSVISSHSSLASVAQSRSRLGTAGTRPQGMPGGAMYDSAICADFQSSGDDDEWREHCLVDEPKYNMEGEGREERERQEEKEGTDGGRPRAKSGIIRRYGEVEEEGHRPLSKISEQSTPVRRASTPVRPPSVQESEPSLEWF